MFGPRPARCARCLSVPRPRWGGATARVTGSPMTQSQAVARALAHQLPVRLAHLSRRVGAARLLAGDAHVIGSLSPAACAAIGTRVTSKAWSVSHLDLLAGCRFRFFAGALLGLERVTRRGLAASPREHGSAAHKALELAYRDIRANGGLSALRRDPETTLARVRRLLFASRAEVLGEAVIHPALEEPALEEALLAVKAVMEMDADRAEAAEPEAFEYRFDDRAGAAALPLTLQWPGRDLTLAVRGSIDRVDVSAEAVWIFDYKRTVAKRSAERHLQLPLYAVVADRDFGLSRRNIRAAWIDVRRQKLVASPEALSSSVERVAALQQSLWERLDAVLSCSVVPDPEPAELCEHCDFSPLCRIGAEADVDAAV
jgi:RecB family exonuclease